MEQVESSWTPSEDGKMEKDHNILAVLAGEDTLVTGEVKKKLTDFVSHVFDHIEGKIVKVGLFLGKEAAVKEIEITRD
jgi:hypothetical protein